MQTKSNPSARFFFSLHSLSVILMCISSCAVVCNNVKHHRHLHRRRFVEDDDDSGNLIVAHQTTAKPDVDSSVASQINVPVDEPAYLHCKILNRGGFVVTWFRHKERQVLTVGEDRFTDDHRFQISYRKLSDTIEDMTLWLRYTRKNDSGIYECQVSTDPPLRFLVTLNVLEVKKLAKKSDLPTPNHSDNRQNNDAVVAPENSSAKSARHSTFSFAVVVGLYAKLLLFYWASY